MNRSFMCATEVGQRDLVRDLFLPTLLFAALGGMTWAVRGSSGFGAVKGCVFAGVTWGAAWWFIARDHSGEQARRYTSGWIILALTVGIGISGGRGWMQWPSFFDGILQTNSEKGEFVPISRTYGFVWLFIAGMPWAGLGACILAWCASGRPLRAWEWSLRIACGFGMAYLLGTLLFDHYPNIFLPLYGSLKDRYQDLQANPNLRRLIGDNQLAIRHLGFYLGFLIFEVGRKDWRNVKLILSVGIANGLGWALCQNWKWAPGLWPNANVNWWRCWESSGGISIGVAYGIAFYLVNRRMSAEEKAVTEATSGNRRPYLVWFASFVLMLALGWFMRNQLQRPSLVRSGMLWANIGNIYFGIVVAYGAAYTLYHLVVGHGMSDEERVARLANGHPDLDWLATFLSLLAILGLFMVGELRGWSGWFVKGEYKPWYSYLYVGMLAVFGVAYYLLNLRVSADEKTLRETSGCLQDPHLERLGTYLGLLLGLGLSIKNGSRGWANIYPKMFPEGENYWGDVFWRVIGPLMLACLVALLVWGLISVRSRRGKGNRFPRALWLMGLVLIIQNVIAQFITGPLSNWREMVFNIYYLVLFLISGTIIAYFQFVKARSLSQESL